MTKILPRLAIMKNVMAIQVQETKKLVMSAQEHSLYVNVEENTIMFKETIKERKTRPVFEEANDFGKRTR